MESVVYLLTRGSERSNMLLLAWRRYGATLTGPEMHLRRGGAERRLYLDRSRATLLLRGVAVGELHKHFERRTLEHKLPQT